MSGVDWLSAEYDVYDISCAFLGITESFGGNIEREGYLMEPDTHLHNAY